MSDIYFMVLLVIGILNLLFVVFLLRSNLHASAPKFPEIKSYDYEINKIMETVRETEDMLLQLKGAETATHEQTKRDLKICNDMLQDVRVTSTVIREEMCTRFNEFSASIAFGLYDNFICEMLLKEKIEISDIPLEIRTSTNSFYITACRARRSYGFTEYNAVLKVMLEDIQSVNMADKARLARLYKKLMYDGMQESVKSLEKAEQDDSDSNAEN